MYILRAKVWRASVLASEHKQQLTRLGQESDRVFVVSVIISQPARPIPPFLFYYAEVPLCF